jgi:uncharacterized membrane protein YeaQ/YmgE (transglycosylase-associated protein family)
MRYLPHLVFSFSNITSNACRGIVDDEPNSHSLLTLMSGAVGGNIGGTLIKDQSLGPVVNAILGLIGGVGGSHLLGALGGLQSLGQIGNIGASGVVRALLPIIIGILKNKFAKA